MYHKALPIVAQEDMRFVEDSNNFNNIGIIIKPHEITFISTLIHSTYPKDGHAYWHDYKYNLKTMIGRKYKNKEWLEEFPELEDTFDQCASDLTDKLAPFVGE